MVGPVHVEQCERSQRFGDARRFGNVPEPAKGPGQTLDGRMVRRPGSLAEGEQATTRAIVGLESFRIDHPVLPADVRKIQNQLLHPTLVPVGDRDRIAGVYGLQKYRSVTENSKEFLILTNLIIKAKKKKKNE